MNRICFAYIYLLHFITRLIVYSRYIYVISSHATKAGCKAILFFSLLINIDLRWLLFKSADMRTNKWPSGRANDPFAKYARTHAHMYIYSIDERKLRCELKIDKIYMLRYMWGRDLAGPPAPFIWGEFEKKKRSHRTTYNQFYHRSNDNDYRYWRTTTTNTNYISYSCVCLHACGICVNTCTTYISYFNRICVYNNVTLKDISFI